MIEYFRSVLEQDTAPVVLCDLKHIIIYMNPAAIARYHKDMTGRSLLACHNQKSGQIINRVLDWFRADPGNNRVHTFYNERENKDVYMVALRNEQGQLIGYYEKHDYRNRDMTPMYDM